MVLKTKWLLGWWLPGWVRPGTVNLAGTPGKEESIWTSGPQPGAVLLTGDIWRRFWLSQLGDAPGTQWVEAGDSAQAPAVPRTALTTKNSLAPNVNSAEAGKSWYKQSGSQEENVKVITEGKESLVFVFSVLGSGDEKPGSLWYSGLFLLCFLIKALSSETQANLSSWQEGTLRGICRAVGECPFLCCCEYEASLRCGSLDAGPPDTHVF